MPGTAKRERDGGNTQDQPTSERAAREQFPRPESTPITRSHPVPNSPSSSASVPTYLRLRSGAWGVRVPERAHPLALGETARIMVHRRSGAIREETVRCFWLDGTSRTGDAVALCELVRSDLVGRKGGPESP